MSTNESKQQLFDTKQKFLREIPHPTLIIKHLKAAAKNADLPPAVYPSFAINVEVDASPLKVYLEVTIQNQLTLKHKISLAQSFADLHAALLELLKLQLQFFTKLASYITPPIPNDLKFIKLSEPTDPYELLKTLNSQKLEENEINHYLCSEMKTANFHQNLLVIGCLRAFKIKEHG